jgi:hypothetical protein
MIKIYDTYECKYQNENPLVQLTWANKNMKKEGNGCAQDLF